MVCLVIGTPLRRHEKRTHTCRYRLSLANMVLVILLALKNTPLAFLTAYSYERLNCLHQIAGYTMFSQMVIHAAMYTSYFNSQGRLLSIYSQRGTIAGIVCGFGFLSVIFSAVFLRRVWYEIFYVVHVASWVVSVIAVGFHQPSIADKTLIVTLIAAVAWILDRIIRACRVLYYSANNEATLHPLPGGGTKIVLKKAPARAEPGKHCFVWIPAIRKFETHPFTIHRSDPVEFTVKARDGFTSDLHKYAAANPGVAVKASVDGPYGTFPDPMEFDKIVLIAGGGGATFTFGLAVNVLERMGEEDKKQIVFIWAVREHGKYQDCIIRLTKPACTNAMVTENLSWFREQLDMLLTQAQTPRVNVSLYVTRASSDISGTQEAQNSGERSSTDSPALSPIETDLEKSISHQRWARTTTTTTTTTATESDTEKDIEKTIETRVEHSKEAATAVTATTKAAQTLLDYPVQLGRPDTAALIRDAVNITPSNQRVLVAACGPDGLMRVVRDTTARLIRGDGPAVEVHCEQFGW